MIFFIENLLSTDELNQIINLSKNFTISDSPTTKEKNYYNRHFIDENIELLDYQKKSIEFANSTLKLKHKISGVWLNQITTETNKNDKFHFDESDTTIVTFINDNFIGGEFEYVGENNNPCKFYPKKNSSILMTNKLIHKVLPVSFGTRYSLVTFMEVINKNKKTIL